MTTAGKRWPWQGDFVFFINTSFALGPPTCQCCAAPSQMDSFQLCKDASPLRRCAFLPLPTVRLCRNLDSDRQIGFATSIPPFSTLPIPENRRHEKFIN